MIKTKNLQFQKYKTKHYDLNQIIEIECDQCETIFSQKLRQQQKQFQKYGLDLCRGCKQKHQYAAGLRNKQIWICKNNARNQKGKTVEALYGAERGTDIKNKMSIATLGKNNGMFGKHQNELTKEKIGNRTRGKTLEEIYGSKKAIEIKQKISNSTSAENNSMYGKPSPMGSGNGWSGWYNGYFFRSLLELAYLKFLIDNKIYFDNGEQKKYSIQYEYDGIIRNYFCDYYLIDENLFVEIKPKKLISTKQNLAKFDAAIQKHGLNFKILTEYDFPQITSIEIISMYECGNLIFIERYNEKFKEIYLDK